ncbi:MAG: DUF1778 domain-containing protein [Terriglobia bacterium]
MKAPAISRSKVRNNSKLARLEARISVQQKKLFQKAASIQGRTVSEFVVASAQEAARSVLEDFESIELSARESKAFVKALLNPPAPSERLRAAAQRYKAQLS